MPKARTLMGVEYQYSGSLEMGLTVHKKVDVRITVDAIKLIKSYIASRSPVLMGACRDNPTEGSIGEVLKNEWMFTTIFELCDSTTCRRWFLQSK